MNTIYEFILLFQYCFNCYFQLKTNETIDFVILFELFFIPLATENKYLKITTIDIFCLQRNLH